MESSDGLTRQSADEARRAGGVISSLAQLSKSGIGIEIPKVTLGDWHSSMVEQSETHHSQNSVVMSLLI